MLCYLLVAVDTAHFQKVDTAHFQKSKRLHFYFLFSSTEEAAWAVGSLVILLTILLSAVCYTKLWRKGNHGESFERSRVWNDESEPGSVSVAGLKLSGLLIM